jgi:hypothetical protein
MQRKCNPTNFPSLSIYRRAKLTTSLRFRRRIRILSYHLYPWIAAALVLGCYILVEWLEHLRLTIPGA